MTLDLSKSALYQAIKVARCWKGYEPVPGVKAYEPGSCRPKGSEPKKNKKLKKEAIAKRVKLAVEGLGYTSDQRAKAVPVDPVLNPASRSYLDTPGFGNWLYSGLGALQHSVYDLARPSSYYRQFSNPATTSLSHMDPGTQAIRDRRSAYNRFMAPFSSQSNTELERQRAMDYIKAYKLNPSAAGPPGVNRAYSDPNFQRSLDRLRNAPDPRAVQRVSTTAQPAPERPVPTPTRPATTQSDPNIKFRAGSQTSFEENVAKARAAIEASRRIRPN